MIRSSNKSIKAHCDNDHYCCQQSKLNESLSRNATILREQVLRLQKQKKFLEEVNVGLMRDFELRVQESLEQQQSESTQMMARIQLQHERMMRDLQHRLDNVQEEYARKLEEQTAELNRQLKKQEQLGARLLADKAEAEQKIEELNSLSKDQAEQIKNLTIGKESEQASIRALREELDNLERDRASHLMKIQGYSLAMKGLQQRYAQMGDRLVLEETHHKQALISAASKESALRSLENELSQQGIIRERLLHENKALQNIVNSLDSHIFDLRKHEYGMMKELQDAHQLAAHKEHALQGIKRDIHTLKFTA